MKKIKAIFKGKNNSCGFLKDREYELKIYSNRDTKNIVILHQLLSKGNVPEGKLIQVEYESINAFFTNWDLIRSK